MPVCSAHYIKNFFYKVERHIFMEQIAHGIDENSARLAHPPRQVDQVVVQREVEAVGVAGIAHRLEPLGHALGVTVAAAFGDLGTAGDGVPGHLGPFDGRMMRQ